MAVISSAQQEQRILSVWADEHKPPLLVEMAINREIARVQERIEQSRTLLSMINDGWFYEAGA